MSYATESDIKDRYGEAELLIAADRDGDGIADTSVITTALDDADDEIDSYLAARYALPLSTVPGILTSIAVDLAMYRMAPTPDAVTESMKERVKDARAWLLNLSKGHVALGVPAPEPETIPQSVQTSSTNPSRVFNRTTMRDL